MYFEWWMIVSLIALWVISMIVHGRVSFDQGCVSTIDVLKSNGYIRVSKNDEIIGLCNQDQENFDSSD